MTDLWMPGAEQVPAPTDKWGTYTGGPFRGVLHTTESDTYTPDRNTYYGHQSWPHFTIGAKIWQHIPINRAARALVNKTDGVQTNNQSAVQTEIVWRAHKAPQMPRDLLDRIAKMMRWVESSVGVKRASSGFVASPGRKTMSDAVWDAYDGWTGHQSVPENDHTDPGLIDIAYLLGATTPQPPPEDDDMQLYVVRDPGPASYISDLLTFKKPIPDDVTYQGLKAKLPEVKVSKVFLDALPTK